MHSVLNRLVIGVVTLFILPEVQCWDALLLKGAQWLSGRVEGPRVRASQASLRCGP